MLFNDCCEPLSTPKYRGPVNRIGMIVRMPVCAAAIGSLVWTSTSRGDTPKPSMRKRKAVIGLPSGRTAMYMLLVVSLALRYTVSVLWLNAVVKKKTNKKLRPIKFLRKIVCF